jgi:hypothetical protein
LIIAVYYLEEESRERFENCVEKTGTVPPSFSTTICAFALGHKMMVCIYALKASLYTAQVDYVVLCGIASQRLPNNADAYAM